jgi:hypothetical protein
MIRRFVSPAVAGGRGLFANVIRLFANVIRLKVR